MSSSATAEERLDLVEIREVEREVDLLFGAAGEEEVPVGRGEELRGAFRAPAPPAALALKPSSSASYAWWPRRRSSATSADLPVPEIPVSSTGIGRTSRGAAFTIG